MYIPQYVEYGDIDCGEPFLEVAVEELFTNSTENNA